MYLYQNPVWKTVDRKQWLNPKGMDIYSGNHAAHVGLHYAGQGKTEVHANNVSGRSTWQHLPNENQAGDESYSLTKEDTAKALLRRRNSQKEVSRVVFVPTSKRSLPMDDKIRVNTLHMMEVLNKAYTMTTKESPQKILTMT